MGDHRLAPTITALLRKLASQAQTSVGRCHSVGVMLVEGGEVTGRAFTDSVARDLDAAQSHAGEGPGLDALRFLQIFNVGCIAAATHWPRFRDVASANAILSSMSVPMSCGGRATGTINLYSRDLDGFEGCEQLAMDLVSRAADRLARAGLLNK